MVNMVNKVRSIMLFQKLSIRKDNPRELILYSNFNKCRVKFRTSKKINQIIETFLIFIYTLIQIEYYYAFTIPLKQQFCSYQDLFIEINVVKTHYFSFCKFRSSGMKIIFSFLPQPPFCEIIFLCYVTKISQSMAKLIIFNIICISLIQKRAKLQIRPLDRSKKTYIYVNFVQQFKKKSYNSNNMAQILNLSSSQFSTESSQKMKRSSKICSALKIRFLTMLQEQGITIKFAAKHLGINYSTAKVIAKEHRFLLKEKQTSNSQHQEQYLPSREKKIKTQKQETPRCSYRDLNSANLESFDELKKHSQIQIISTVAWNFIQWGLPSSHQQA